MSTRALQNIIKIENELHAGEKAEQEKIEKWLQEQERSIAAEYQAKKAKLADEKEKVTDQARSKAAERTKEIIREAQQRAAALEGVDDATLNRHLEQKILSILTWNLP